MDVMQALAVIDAVPDRADESTERGQDLVNAMACLRDWGIDRAELVDFWKCLDGEHAVGWWQSANGDRNRIKFLVNEKRREREEIRNPSHGDW